MKRTTTFTAAALIIDSSLVGFGSNAAFAAPMTFLVDTLGHNPGDGYTLREALADADANPGPDTIEFAEGLARTLALSGRELSSSDSLTIDGPADSETSDDGVLARPGQSVARSTSATRCSPGTRLLSMAAHT
jgi:hypothetical protein